MHRSIAQKLPAILSRRMGILAAPSPGSFTFEPLFALLAVAALVLYFRAARSDRPPVLMMASFVIGVGLIGVSLNSPLETLAVNYLLLAHLAQNALIADIAPPLVLLGLTGAMWSRCSAVIPRPLHVFAQPMVALPIWLVTWYGVHLAGIYDAAVSHPEWLNLEHAVLIGAGFAFWSPVVGTRWGGRSPVGLVPYLIVAFVAVSFLGLGLTFIPHPFYPYYTHTPRLLGMSPTEDQNLGGVVMTAEQSLVYLAGIAALLLILANREQQRVEAAQRDAPLPNSE